MAEDFGTSASIALIVYADAVMLPTVNSIGFAVHIFGAQRSSVATETRRAREHMFLHHAQEV
jgi:hypothetical protein